MVDVCLHVRKRSIYYLLFFIAFIRPEYLVKIEAINIFYDFYRIIVVMVVGLVFLIKRVRPSKYTFIWFVFEAWILLITLLRGGNLLFAINQALAIASVAIFWQMNSKDVYHICKVMYYLLGFFIIINFITLIIFPEGMYSTGVTNIASENWFLGFKNKHMIYFLPFMGLNFIFGKTDGFNLKKLLMMIVVIASALYEKSSTTIICMFLMLLIGFLPFIREHYKIFNMYSYFGVSILMFIMIPLFRLQYLFSYFIVNIFHKSIDLTNRTDLWDRAFIAIRQHIFAGWGEQIDEVKHNLYGSQSIVSAHNQILEYLYIGGIVLLALYIIINFMLATKLHRSYNSVIIQIASGMYLALQVALVVEVYTDTIIYMLYFLLWYIDELGKNKSLWSRIE